MSLYPKQSLQMLVDLINTANPNLPVALTTTNVLYGSPAVITPGSGQIQNTSIKITAIASSKYIGNTTLTYRRIDFGTLFRSLPIVIYKYSPAATNAAPYKISDLLPAINAKYGLNLTTADIVDASLPAGNTNAVPSIGLAAGTRNSSVTVATQTTSPGYVGSFTLYWVQAPQDISTMITVTNLETARVYPGGQSVVSASPRVVDLDVFSYDFTAGFNSAAVAAGTSLANFISWLGSFTLGQSGIATQYQAVQTQFMAALVAATGQAYNQTSPASTNLSLYGIKPVHYSLPNAAVPEADSKYFNNCMVLDMLTANNTVVGRMILHYNV